MGELIGALFGGPVEPKVQGPSAQEIAAQKKQETLIDAKNRRESSERQARGKIITARSAGPQTLFARSENIPRARKLGGGRE